MVLGLNCQVGSESCVLYVLGELEAQRGLWVWISNA